MAPGGCSFDRFHLDPGDRLLTRDDVPVELNARYPDALILLASVPKDRFRDEGWRRVPVTDEALTQCIRTIRRRLRRAGRGAVRRLRRGGDDPGAPEPDRRIARLT